MKLIQCFLKQNDCYKAGRKITPKGVMVHSTGANNPKICRYVQPNVQDIGLNTANNHWNKPGISKCVHAFIGKLRDGSVATVQTLPWNHRGWHGGGSSNNTHIGFEICEDGLKDANYFKAVYQEAVQLTAMLCKTYKLDPLKDGVVICHSEGHKRGIASNHADVMHWFPKHGKTMDDFRADVKKAMGKATTEKTSGSGATVNITLDVLKKGSKSQAVKSLQVLLDGMGYHCQADGSFGPATETQVKSFQMAKKLSVDGVVGAKTWSALLGR
jgi:N-acetyl-anhydromuramyl-L-alanine amidase AmpD